MIARIFLSALLLPLAALAQLQVFEFNGTTDTAVGALVNVGTAAPGDTLETRFHVRNVGAGPATLSTLALSGQGFSIVSAPSLPYILAPYVGPASEAEVDIDFTPTTIGSFSAFLAVNTISITLQGTSAAAATLTLAGSQTPLTAGATVGFGSVAVGANQTQGFILSNPGSASVTVGSVSVSGSAFALAAGLTTPVQIAPGQSVTFQITFAPTSGTAFQGTLAVDNRTFTLTGQGLDPPLPSASIVFASNVGASAQQNSITIQLAAASQVSGNGTLTMAFQPSVTGVTDDVAIQFLSGPLRIATVAIAVGATSATIGGESSMPFQTGTTAGTITFTLTLTNVAPQQATLIIPPAPINLDSITAVALFGSINVAFSGFDNTYTASQIAFTFYDITGQALPQGAIDVNAATAFQQYFSTTQAGGSFQVLAMFPVSGNEAEVGFVTVQVVNSLGTTTAAQIAIGN
jgi:Abnormal spindle-like microcephaly-assoc'd, ASPM-SPD-2-Hydin